MWRLAILFHVIIAPTLMGVLILAVMMVPTLQDALGKWIVIASAVGFLGAVPISFMAAKANAGKLARR